jgi:hypothetical protein
MSSFKKEYSGIMISIYFLGIYWECWAEYNVLGDDHGEFFIRTREKYRKKLGDRKFIMRLYYPDDKYLVTKNNVTPFYD